MSDSENEKSKSQTLEETEFKIKNDQPSNPTKGPAPIELSQEKISTTTSIKLETNLKPYQDEIPRSYNPKTGKYTTLNQTGNQPIDDAHMKAIQKFQAERNGPGLRGPEPTPATPNPVKKLSMSR